MKRMIFATSMLGLIVGSATAHATIKSGPVVASFLTTDDDYAHAIIATTNDCITEVYWDHSHSWHSGGALADGCFSSPIVAVGGFYSSYDGYRHAIVGLGNGQIWEYYYGSGGHGKSVLFTVSSGTIRGVAGWQGYNYKYHAAVMTTAGCLTDFEYGPVVSSPGTYSPGCWGSSVTGIHGTQFGGYDAVAISFDPSYGDVEIAWWADSSHISSYSLSYLSKYSGTGSIAHESGIGMSTCYYGSTIYNLVTVNPSWEVDHLDGESTFSTGSYYDNIMYSSWGYAPTAISGFSFSGAGFATNNAVVISNSTVWDVQQGCTGGTATVYGEGSW